MTKREGELKSAFGKCLKELLPSFYLFEIATAGMPDRGIAGAGRTTYWEFKHGTPEIDSPGNQQLMCMRLDHACYCRYVIWQEDALGGNPRTMIIRPAALHRVNGNINKIVPELVTHGFDHTWLVKRILEAHHHIYRA